MVIDKFFDHVHKHKWGSALLLSQHERRLPDSDIDLPLTDGMGPGETLVSWRTHSSCAAFDGAIDQPVGEEG